MTPAWLHADLTKPVDAPLKGGPSDRNAQRLIDVVGQFQVASAERYRRRDITGDDIDETFCNFFVADATRALGCAIPQQRANAMIDWLEYHGESSGWWPLGEELARAISAIGGPVVAGWKNPNFAAPGHVAILVPPLGDGLWVAQAGHTNFSCEPIANGFGSLHPRFWGHG